MSMTDCEPANLRCNRFDDCLDLRGELFCTFVDLVSVVGLSVFSNGRWSFDVIDSCL